MKIYSTLLWLSATLIFASCSKVPYAVMPRGTGSVSYISKNVEVNPIKSTQTAAVAIAPKLATEIVANSPTVNLPKADGKVLASIKQFGNYLKNPSAKKVVMPQKVSSSKGIIVIGPVGNLHLASLALSAFSMMPFFIGMIFGAISVLFFLIGAIILRQALWGWGILGAAISSYFFFYWASVYSVFK